ncbi:hypothetical protein BDD12DRAFT_903423 [Trichophaea hybrida]|nr:hypothetical protein BDD12DRAFT_903423 [Trichophaea hybrida]
MNPTNAPRFSASSTLLKSLSSVIHPPLPLTPRESNTLLRAVQDSFRQQLVASDVESSAVSSNDPRAPYASPNAHLGNVLKMVSFSSSPEEARKQREQRIKRYLVDPISVFEEHVSLGTATIDLARCCLARYNDHKTDSMDSQLGGSRVLKGLLTAGLLERPEHILDNTALSYNLLVALVHEGKEDLLVRWTLQEDSSRSRKFIQQVEKHFGLERATQVFFAFYERLSDPPNTQLMAQVLGVIGRELCRAAKKTGALLTPQFDRLLSTSQHWAISPAENTMIQLRFGNNVQPGLEFFASIDACSERWWADLSATRRKKFALLGMELAQGCLAQGRLNDGLKVSRVVSKRFAEQLGGSPRQPVESRAAQTRGEAAEHLEVFREMFKGALRKEKLSGSLV